MSSPEKTTSLPEYAPHPYTTYRNLDLIPMGIGAKGEISIDLFNNAHTLISGYSGSGKSIVEKNVLLHCERYKEIFDVYAVDFKKADLASSKRHYGVIRRVTTTLEDTAHMIDDIHEEMMRRYQEMKKEGVSHYNILEHASKAMVLLVDEAYFMLSPSDHPQEKADDALKEKIAASVLSLARLGRAARIHMFLVTQKPDSRAVKSELRSNFDTRIVMGRTDTVLSHMVLGDDSASRTSPVRGRGRIRTNHDEVQEFQAYHPQA